MNVTVIYPFDAHSGLQTFKFEVAGTNPESILETVWRRMNVVTGDPDIEIPINAQARSMMVGDIAILHWDKDNADHYICQMIGFCKVSKDIAEVWQTMSSRDRCMGFDWVVKKALLAFRDNKA